MNFEYVMNVFSVAGIFSAVLLVVGYLIVKKNI